MRLASSSERVKLHPMLQAAMHRCSSNPAEDDISSLLHGGRHFETLWHPVINHVNNASTARGLPSVALLVTYTCL